ncbi:hypothetical protein AXY43_15790 [Clostridium sp. MF28]|uniref:hypothetical protein n=1 Tax=Clostridium TaxID=1485 RepID=UPI000CF98DBB|nr:MULTISPECIES: hypothetical protein [Clostridium]AVK49342.1 hypothetical protein AXY43_15790 [Clostridium sp. MF28]PSM58044.1 hypothetical protein C4L39_09525 [Clostridium diolis]
MISEIMNSYTNNTNLIIISAFTFLIGYVEYIYSFRLVIREKSAPYPIWMHTFYLAHDFTGSVVFFMLAKNNNWFWFFTTASVALLIWNCFELFNLYMAVKVERQEIWGKFYDSPVTVRQAILRIMGQVALMAVVVNLFRVFMNDEVMFKWFAFTNILIAVAPGYLWNERKSRKGSSIGLAIVIFIGTVNTFLPPEYGMWTTASKYFDQPWFYITGVIVSLYALRNVIMLLRFPIKEKNDGKKVIW